jgi:hypothetical protein
MSYLGNINSNSNNNIQFSLWASVLNSWSEDHTTESESREYFTAYNCK